MAFSAIYIATARWMANPPSQALGLSHFGLMTVAVILFATISIIGSPNWNDAASDISRVRSYVSTANAGLLAALLGWAIFVVNIGWAAIRTIRMK